MVQAEGVEVKFQIDDKDFRAKFDEAERKLKKLETDGKKAARTGSGAFIGAAIGGAVGFIAGAATNNPAVNAIMDLLLNVVAAMLLPLITSLLPAIEKFVEVAGPLFEKLGESITAIIELANLLAGNGYQQTPAEQMYMEQRREQAQDRPWWEKLLGINPGKSQEDRSIDSRVGDTWAGHAPTPTANRDRLYGPDVHSGG